MDAEGGLIIRLMQRNANDAAFVTTQLMEGYKNDRDRLEKEITMIRTGISRLFATGYQPTESAVLAALYPAMD